MRKPTLPLTTLIVDDEPLSRERIKNLISNDPDFKIIGECDSGTSTVAAIDELLPDLVFLDISLPEFDGFAILEKINSEIPPIIIIVSASEEHALKAFEYYAFDYLLKPYLDTRFNQTINQIKNWISQLQSNDKISEKISKENTSSHLHSQLKDFIPIKGSGKINFVKKNTIEFVEASGYYIEINTGEKKYLMRESMSNILEVFDPKKFIRIHRSIIINLEFMEEIVRVGRNEYGIKMRNGKFLKVSKSYKKDLFDVLDI